MLFKTIARGTGWSAKLVSSLTIAALIITAIPLAFLFPSEAHASTISETFSAPGATSWIVPAGVTSITVEAWGGGGGAKDSDASDGQGGGGGGAYVRSTLSVTPGATLSLHVGAGGPTNTSSSATSRNGEDSWFNSSSTLKAQGGKGGTASGGNGGATSGSNSIGDVEFAGGNGGNRGGDAGGGGGGSATTSGNGGNGGNGNSATNPDTGGAGGIGEGNGGEGGDDVSGSAKNGQNGFAPGGGGGGGAEQSSSTSGAGASGQIKISYEEPVTTLTLVKEVTNDNGGEAEAGDWTLSAVGPDSISGVSDDSAVTAIEVEPGTYDLSESDDPSGYSASAWVCDGGNQTDEDTVELSVGDDVTCTITNDDSAPSFTLNKIVVNTGGGTEVESAWTLTATGAQDDPVVLSGSGDEGSSDVVSDSTFQAGTYTLSETGPDGYTSSEWSCTGDGLQVDNTIALAVGESATCTITNTYDIPAPDPDPIENSCALPDTESGPAEIAIGVSPEVTLQSILDTAGYSLDADDDQANYQTWQTNGLVDVSFSATFLKKIAGAGSVFGYYTDGDLNSFEPLFRVGTHDDFPAVAVFSEGQSVAFSVENFDDIGFAVHIQDGETKRVYATERILNSATEDHAIVYNPESNEYVLAFEDRPFASGDEDYNDLVVKLEVTDCEDAPLCTLNQELLANGGFETPEVTHGAHWDIFPSGTTGLGWLVEWFGGSLTYGDTSRPEIANMELQENGLSTWTANEGTQWTELDSDWGGPDVSLNGEPGSVAISQTVGTEVGKQYTFSFEFSPRPGTAATQNVVEVLANGTVIGTVGPLAASGVLTEWTHHSFNFVATTTSTTFTLRDAGTPNDSLGTFIDDASLMCTVPMATISASKVVCDAEEYLPNWGDGLKADTSSAEPITATTAQEWVDQSNEHCWLANDWKFQWAPDGTGNPGDDVEHSVASGWTTFGPTVSGIITVQVPAANLVWVREELKPGYIGFTGQNSDQDVSAEFYCDLDVFNYDNYDFISPAVANQTYHCVAFNAPVEPPPGAPTLTIVKQTDGDDDTFEFDIVKSESLVGSLSTTTSGAIGTTTTMTLEEGTYSIWEIEQLDWDLTNVQCVYNGDSSGFIGNPNGHQIVVHNGDEVICTFTNVEVTPQCPEGTHYDEKLDECVESNGDSFSDLSIVKTVDDETPDVGQQITYTITLTNEGPQGDGNIVVSDLLPAGVSYVSHTASAGTYEENVGLWSVPSLSDEGSATLTIVVEVGSGEEGQLIINTATILENDSVDEDSENDSDDASITVNSGGGGDDDDDDTPTPPGGGGPLGLFGGGPLGGGIVAGTSTEGQVLGESCGLFMDKYLRFGKKNDVEQTKNLQEFLNKWMQSGLPITGFFGPLTLQAVMDFQNQYAAQVLTPWGLTSPTGIVYITTLRWMNLLECPDLALELPALVEWSKNPGVPL